MGEIELYKINKSFNIGYKKSQSALSRSLSFISGVEQKRKINVLKDVDFRLRRGEILGIIGSNGSGKSTILRIIAGIYSKDSGKVYINGKIISLINLGISFQQRLSVLDNIYLCCSFFDISRNEVRRKLNSIIGFSELEEFANTKLYQLSNGMQQRLAFSIAIHCNPDILLMDEVFESGDQSFRKKSGNAIIKLLNKGASIILVSHDIELIEERCDRVIWLEKGIAKFVGSPKKAIAEYKKSSISNF